MDIEVNYKNKKRYKTAKYPLKQRLFWIWLIRFLSKIMLIGKKYKIEKVNMEGLKPPYMLLSNHMHFIDFELAAQATWPHSVSNVVSIDGYVIKWFLLEWIGAICTRKYTNDLHLIKSIRHVLKRGDILSMYPEARYTPCGTTSFLPESLGKLVKMNKVPVVTVIHRGNHLYAPFWNFRDKRKVPFHTTFTQLLTAEQVEKMTPQEINDAIKNALQYDDYRYQKENGIIIKETTRAEGLHKVLYQCPNCKTEFSMNSKGEELFCEHCSKRWVWQEDGYIRALSGETEFDHIPDWYNWQKTEVQKQIADGSYRFEDDVEVFSLPRVWRYIPLGKAKLTHDINEGFVLEGFYRGQKWRVHRLPQQMNSLHVEYDFGPLKKFDYIDISNENDSFYCRLTDRNRLTKLAFATEEIFLKSQNEIKLKLNK